MTYDTLHTGVLWMKNNEILLFHLSMSSKLHPNDIMPIQLDYPGSSFIELIMSKIAEQASKLIRFIFENS